MDGFKPVIVELGEEYSADDLWVHDEHDHVKATLLSRFFDDPREAGNLPRPFGIFYQAERFRYEEAMETQLTEAQERKGAGDLDALLRGHHNWQVD